MRFLTSGVVAVLGCIALTTAAHADVIYSNFSPGDTYTTNSGWTIGTNTNQSVAGVFTASQNYALTSFDIAAGHVSGTNSYLFSLVADNAGLPTGAAVVSPFGGALASGFATTNTTSFAATGSLLAGQTYWLVMEAGAGNTWGAWNLNTSGATGFAIKTGAGNWVPDNRASPTFRINGRPTDATALTPELPAGVQAIPVLLAVGGMALYQRKKKAAQR